MENFEETFTEVTMKTLAGVLDSAEAEVLFAYWQSRSLDNKIPLWDAFSIVDIPTVVPHLVLVEVKRKPLQFVTTMMGTELIAESGLDNTNTTTHETPGATRTVKRFETVVGNRAGYFLAKAPVSWGRNDYKRHSALILPLTDGEGEINHLVGWVGNFIL